MLTVRQCPLTMTQQEERGCQAEAPSPPSGHSLPHTQEGHKGPKSTASTRDVSAEGTDAIPQEEISVSKASKGCVSPFYI